MRRRRPAHSQRFARVTAIHLGGMAMLLVLALVSILVSAVALTLALLRPDSQLHTLRLQHQALISLAADAEQALLSDHRLLERLVAPWEEAWFTPLVLHEQHDDGLQQWSVQVRLSDVSAGAPVAWLRRDHPGHDLLPESLRALELPAQWDASAIDAIVTLPGHSEWPRWTSQPLPTLDNQLVFPAAGDIGSNTAASSRPPLAVAINWWQPGTLSLSTAPISLLEPWLSHFPPAALEALIQARNEGRRPTLPHPAPPEIHGVRLITNPQVLLAIITTSMQPSRHGRASPSTFTVYRQATMLVQYPQQGWQIQWRKHLRPSVQGGPP